MKRGFGLTTVLVAMAGIWAGASAWRSSAIMTNVQAGLAILIAANLLFCLWLWRRAQPGSGDAMVLPGTMLLSVAMLLGIVPKLFWPAAEGVQIAGTIASVIVVTIMLVLQIRNRRSLRRAAQASLK